MWSWEPNLPTQRVRRAQEGRGVFTAEGMQSDLHMERSAQPDIVDTGGCQSPPLGLVPLLPGLPAANGSQLSPFRGATFGQGHGSLPQGQPHPTSGPCRGTKATSQPLLGTPLQGHPSSRAPGASLWEVTDGIMSPTALCSPPSVTTCTAVTGGCVSVPGLPGQPALFPS